MLALVTDVLTELQLIPRNAKLRFNVNIGTGVAMAVSVFLGSRHLFQVKMTEASDLTSEYAAQVRAWEKFGELVPRPLGYRVLAGWHIFVMQGVQHSHFPLHALERGRLPVPVMKGLYRFFEIGAQQQQTMGNDDSLHVFFSKMAQHFSATRYADLAARWIDFGRVYGVESLPRIAQHGDFVQNNLAISGNRLVIFDWEDFGSSHLPGLDIFSLYISIAPEAAGIRNLMNVNHRSAGPLDAIVWDVCAMCQLEVVQFKRIVPLYLLTLLYIRRGYGQAGQDRIGKLLRNVSE